LPLGAAVGGANRQDASFTDAALASVVVPSPVQTRLTQGQGECEVQRRRYEDGKLTGATVREMKNQFKKGQDVRALPYLRADGNLAKLPARYDAKQQGFRLWAPEKDQSRRGLGRIRSSVERVHALLNQFGRIFRRLDRRQSWYLGWVQLACCVIFMRQGFFP
jgi:hypothetical protein